MGVLRRSVFGGHARNFSSRELLLRFFSQHDSELGFAGFGWIVEGAAFAVMDRSVKEEALLGIFRQANETGLALSVGTDLQVKFVEIHESVGDVNSNVGGIDGQAGYVGNDEISGAGTQAGVDLSNGF